MEPFLTNAPPRKLAYIDVSPELLIEFCKREAVDRTYQVSDAIPDDATLVWVELNQRVIRIVLTSESFEPVEPGQPIPRMPVPTIRTTFLEPAL